MKKMKTKMKESGLSFGDVKMKEVKDDGEKDVKRALR